MSNTYDNSGALFVNDKKEQPNHPDRTGKATIDGVEYWVSGWIKEGQRGKWMSLAFKRKEQPAEQPARGGGAKPGKPALDDDSEIPF